MSTTQLTLCILLLLAAYGFVGEMDDEEALRSARQAGILGEVRLACTPSRYGSAGNADRMEEIGSVRIVRTTQGPARSPVRTLRCVVLDEE
jgi:hypothetical protein